jgi:2-iminobutanoate/2-iminopropanoate deaminase
MQKPLGPYTPIVRAGDWLIVSGQVGAKDGQLADGVAGQTAQSIKNLAGQLATMGATLDDVKKTLCFLVDMADFETFNEAYTAASATAGRPDRPSPWPACPSARRSRSRPGPTSRSDGRQDDAAGGADGPLLVGR